MQLSTPFIPGVASLWHRHPLCVACGRLGRGQAAQWQGVESKAADQAKERDWSGPGGRCRTNLCHAWQKGWPPMIYAIADLYFELGPSFSQDHLMPVIAWPRLLDAALIQEISISIIRLLLNQFSYTGTDVLVTTKPKSMKRLLLNSTDYKSDFGML